MSPTSIFEKLYRRAYVRGYMIGYPESKHYQDLIKDGKELPDKLKPGALLKDLTKEELEALSKLKPEHIKWRSDAIWG